MITPTDFLARFPEFSLVSGEKIQTCITMGSLIVGTCAYVEFVNELLFYASAHCLKKSLETAAGNWSSMGPINDFDVGELAGSYGATQASKTLFTENMSATKYGQQYLEFLETMKLSYYPFSIMG